MPFSLWKTLLHACKRMRVKRANNILVVVKKTFDLMDFVGVSWTLGSPTTHLKTFALAYNKSGLMQCLRTWFLRARLAS